MILTRYIGRVYLGVVCLTLTTLVTLVVAVTLVENAGILANQATGSRTALQMALFGGLDYAYQVLPIACFIGTLAAGCTLAQRGELLAVQAIGWGKFRIQAPFLAVTCLVAALGGACAETVLPEAVSQRARLQREEIRHVDPLTQFYERRNPWFRQGDTLLYLPELDRDNATFLHPVVYHIDAGQLRASTQAAALAHTAAGWHLLDAVQESLQPPGHSHHRQLPIALDVSPTDLMDVTGNPREMSVPSLWALIGRRRRAGFDTTAHRIELQARLAHPVICLGLVFLALPWAIDPQRRRTLSGALGPGVVIVALYLATGQIFRLLALAHKMPVFWGAWGAPALLCACAPLSAKLWAYRRH
jgi:lipopolysaccharide export system permease protein